MDGKELAVLKNIIRIGMVQSVDAGNQTARVAFADKPDAQGNPLISAPLKVLQNSSLWIPPIGQFVLCLFLPNGESDGFILGGI